MKPIIDGIDGQYAYWSRISDPITLDGKFTVEALKEIIEIMEIMKSYGKAT